MTEIVHLDPRPRAVSDEAGEIIGEMSRPVAACLAEAGTLLALLREGDRPHLAWLCEDLEARLLGIQHQHHQLVCQYATGR
jgi:hypothetical protein